MDEPLNLEDRIRLRVTIEFLDELMEFTRQPWIQTVVDFLVEIRDGETSLDLSWYDDALVELLNLANTVCDWHEPMSILTLTCPVCRNKRAQQR